MSGHSADELGTQGAALLEQGDFSGALACFSAALKQRPRDLSLRCYEIAALIGLQRHAEALTRIDGVLAGGGLTPESRANVLTGKGSALVGLDRWDEAAAVLDDALAVPDAPANAWLLRGHVAMHAGEHAQALDDYRKAIAAGTEAQDKAHLLAGWCLLGLRRFSEAEDDFFGVMLRQGGRMPEAYWGMAMAARGLGQTPVAIQYLEQFVQLGGYTPATLAAAERMLNEWRGEAGEA